MKDEENTRPEDSEAQQEALHPLAAIFLSLSPPLYIWWQGVPNFMVTTFIGFGLAIAMPSFVKMRAGSFGRLAYGVSCFGAAMVGMVVGAAIWGWD